MKMTVYFSGGNVGFFDKDEILYMLDQAMKEIIEEFDFHEIKAEIVSGDYWGHRRWCE